MPARILLTLNNSFVSEHALESEVVTIGRRAENDISIDNMAVSGRHARILNMSGESFLEDLESTNGTFLNGEQISKKMLKNGDRIGVGQHILTYESGRPSPEAEDLDKTVVIKPYAVGMDGGAAFKVPEKPQEAASAAPADGQRPALLQLISGPNNGKKMALTKSITRLGKPGEQVAAIAKRPQGYFIMHLGGDSAQPLLNGNKVGTQAVALSSGDLIELGKVRMKILIPTTP